jgi:hypothetical protein
MKLTRAQVAAVHILIRQLNSAGVPQLLTRGEAARICDDHGLYAPMFQRGRRSTPTRRIDVIIYMVRRGVTGNEMSTYTVKLHHDYGTAKLIVSGTNEASVRALVMASEGCPERSITSIKEATK